MASCWEYQLRNRIVLCGFCVQPLVFHLCGRVCAFKPCITCKTSCPPHCSTAVAAALRDSPKEAKLCRQGSTFEVWCCFGFQSYGSSLRNKFCFSWIVARLTEQERVLLSLTCESLWPPSWESPNSLVSLIQDPRKNACGSTRFGALLQQRSPRNFTRPFKVEPYAKHCVPR